MEKRQVEVFTAGCPLCAPVIDMVSSLSSDEYNVTVYDLLKQCETKECIDKVSRYGIKRLPAIAINGKLMDNFVDAEFTKEQFELAIAI